MTPDDTLAALRTSLVLIANECVQPTDQHTIPRIQSLAHDALAGVRVAPSPTGVAPYSDPARGVENEAGRPALPTREAQGGEPTPPGATASSSPLAPSPDALREAAQAILDRALDFFDDDDLDPESSLAMSVVLKARDVAALRAALEEADRATD